MLCKIILKILFQFTKQSYIVHKKGALRRLPYMFLALLSGETSTHDKYDTSY